MRGRYKHKAKGQQHRRGGVWQPPAEAAVQVLKLGQPEPRRMQHLCGRKRDDGCCGCETTQSKTRLKRKGKAVAKRTSALPPAAGACAAWRRRAGSSRWATAILQGGVVVRTMLCGASESRALACGLSRGRCWLTWSLVVVPALGCCPVASVLVAGAKCVTHDVAPARSKRAHQQPVVIRAIRKVAAVQRLAHTSSYFNQRRTHKRLKPHPHAHLRQQPLAASFERHLCARNSDDVWL